MTDAGSRSHHVSTTVPAGSEAQQRRIQSEISQFREFHVQATRRSRTDRITREQATGLVDSWTRFPVQEATVALMEAAFEIHRRFGISYWDAAIIGAARALGRRVVLSEDLVHGTDYDGIEVENPFAHP
jgi:predicted nucleic acid-binding protein